MEAGSNSANPVASSHANFLPLIFNHYIYIFTADNWNGVNLTLFLKMYSTFSSLLILFVFNKNLTIP